MEKRADGLGFFLTASIYVKYPHTSIAVFLHFRRFFFRFRRALPAALLCFVYLLSRWRLSLVCFASLSTMLVETNIVFQLSFKYFHIFHCNILYFIYYHLLILSSYILPLSIAFPYITLFPLLSPASILSSSILSFLYTSVTFYAFFYVLLVQSYRTIIIYLA